MLEGWELSVDGGLGVRAAAYVGDEASVVLTDPFATEGVSPFPVAVGVRLGRAPWFGELRLEEGSVHAGGVEAAAARVGVELPVGLGELWAGRDDVRFTADRSDEPEDLLFTVRPAVSRAWLPLHASGAGATLGWSGRVGLSAGAAWATTTSDAPYLFARLEATPLGPLPERAASFEAEPRVRLGGAVARLDSEALGVQLGYTVDGALRVGVLGVGASWTSVDRGFSTSALEASVDVRFLPRRPWSPYVAARVERLEGLLDGEGERWIVASRVALDTMGRRVTAFAETYHSIEPGVIATNDDVVVLDGRLERANDAVVIGLLLHP